MITLIIHLLLLQTLLAQVHQNRSQIASSYANWALQGKADSVPSISVIYSTTSPSPFYQENLFKVRHYIHPVKQPFVRNETNLGFTGITTRTLNPSFPSNSRLYPQRIQPIVRLPETLFPSTNSPQPQSALGTPPVGRNIDLFSTPPPVFGTISQPLNVVSKIELSSPSHPNQHRSFLSPTFPQLNHVVDSFPPMSSTLRALASQRHKIHPTPPTRAYSPQIEEDFSVESMDKEDPHKALSKKKQKFGSTYRRMTYYPSGQIECEFGWCGRVCCMPRPQMASPTTVHAMAIPGGANPPSPMVFVLHPHPTVAPQTQCAPSCQPMCLPGCSSSFRHEYSAPQCREDCMPGCHVDCLIIPPETTPCRGGFPCRCAPGYMQCAPMICCHMYRNMAKKLRADVDSDLQTRMNSTIFHDKTWRGPWDKLVEGIPVKEVEGESVGESLDSFTTTTTTTTASTTTEKPCNTTSSTTTSTTTTTTSTTTTSTTPSTTSTTTPIASSTKQTIVFRSPSPTSSSRSFEVMEKESQETTARAWKQPNWYTKSPRVVPNSEEGSHPMEKIKTTPKTLIPIYPIIPSYEQWEMGKKRKKDLDSQFISSNTFIKVLQDLVGLQAKLDPSQSREANENDEFRYFDMLVNNSFGKRLFNTHV